MTVVLGGPIAALERVVKFVQRIQRHAEEARAAHEEIHRMQQVVQAALAWRRIYRQEHGGVLGHLAVCVDALADTGSSGGKTGG